MQTQVVTTRHGGAKAWAWSYSKLKNFETCPKRHWHIDLAKDVKEDESEELKFGNDLHKAMARRLEKGEALPKQFQSFEPWALKVLSPFGRMTGAKLLVEQQLAINEALEPVTWFDKQAWYRGIADVLTIWGPVAMAGDWKTGKVKEDGSQLALMAACVFAHHPQVERIRTEFFWLKEDATSRADFSRADMVGMWNGMAPRVQTMKQAHDQQNYPPKSGPLCRRWCPVVACPHHGT